MTVSSENRRVDYDGNDVADTFPFHFMILRPQDLRVVQADPFGAETVLTLGADYTVSGVGVGAGGEIRLTAGPLPTGHHLTMLRNMQLLQPTDLRNQGAYSPEVVETSLDRIVMTLQQQQEELDRALKVRESSQEHPDSLIASVKESEAAAERAAQTATEKAGEAEDYAQQAADAAAVLDVPIGKSTTDPATPISGSLLTGAMLAAGAIVEQGENANGQYWRWESGMQACVALATHTCTVSAFTSKTLPAAFSHTPIVSGPTLGISNTGTGAEEKWWERHHLITSAPLDHSRYYLKFAPTQEFPLMDVGGMVSVIAIGRWK